MVVGLGNPGREYAGTRHNIGVEVIDVLARRHDGRLRSSKHQAMTGDIRIGGERVMLAFPLTYMNESGQAVSSLVSWCGLEDLGNLVIVHDELDLEPGRIKIKQGGGLAGHNGLRSIKAHLHDDDFTRVRIGVGKPPSAGAGRSHVLRKPSRAERVLFDEAVVRAADAVERILADGVAATMNEFNQP